MRFVDNTQIGDALSTSWRVKAAKAKQDASAAKDAAARRRIIEKNGDMWRTARPALAAISSDRCWYCEVREARSDMPVDHFRPKGRVADEPAHPGYWWLAYDWKNFRLSCTYCNSRRVDVVNGTDGGKQDHFPLCAGSQRAMSDTDDVSKEIPQLLDPCCHGDPPLLSFRQDGMPVPSRDEAVDAVAHERAKCSIHFLHLDHNNLVRERKSIYRRVDELVDRGSRYIDKGLDALGGPLDNVKGDLHGMIRGGTALCRVARLSLRGRRNLDWVREWLEDIETTL